MAYHIAICDDNTADIQYLSTLLQEWAGQKGTLLRTDTFPTAEAFLFHYQEEKDYDILLLDIEMPGMDGMALAKKLRGMGERLGIIFVTGNPEFALEGYDLEAVSYIVKPIKREPYSRLSFYFYCQPGAKWCIIQNYSLFRKWEEAL